MRPLSLIPYPSYFIIAALWILKQVRSHLSSLSARRAWSIMTFEEPCCHSRAIMNTDMTKDRWVGSEARAPPWIAPSFSLAMQEALIGRRLADLEGPPRVSLTWTTSARRTGARCVGALRIGEQSASWCGGLFGWYFCFLSLSLSYCGFAFLLLIVLKIIKSTTRYKKEL